MKILIFLHLLDALLANELCKQKLITGNECISRQQNYGKFTTLFPWSYNTAQISLPDSSRFSPNDPSYSENSTNFTVYDKRPACTVDYALDLVPDIEFILFNKHHNLSNPMYFDPSDDVNNLEESNYLKNTKTIIFTHGWISSAYDNSSQLTWSNQLTDLVTEVLANQDEYNVLFLDWGPISETVKYWLPATNIQVIGAIVGNFVKDCLEENLNTLDNFHLVGHSLGAHLMGYAGKWFKKNTKGQKLPKITGLDPAGPMFQFLDDPALREIRIDIDDAEVVEVFHSNAGDLGFPELVQIIQDCDIAANPSCLTSSLDDQDPTEVGINISVGTVDFWPNGGRKGHGWCDDFFAENSENIGEYFLGSNCLHSFAWKYWMATINNKCHNAVVCDSNDDFLAGNCVNNTEVEAGFDFEIQNDIIGKNIYSKTDAEWPFCSTTVVDPEETTEQPVTTNEPGGTEDPDNSNSKTSLSIFVLFSSFIPLLIV